MAVLVMKDEICEISIDEYSKCSDIWNMETCPFTEDFKNQIKAGNRFVYIYKKNNMFLGEVDLVTEMNEKGYTIKGKRIYLSRLIVKKEYRKQGIGNKLLEFAVNKATQFGYSEISLGVNCDNHAAYRLYLNNGFFVFETARDEYGKYYKMLKNVKGSDMNVEPQGNAGHYDQKASAQRDQGK